MPQNRYSCECGTEWGHIGAYKPRSCPSCSKEVIPSLPTDIAVPTVFETVDPSRNIKWRDNFKEKAEIRNAFYNKKSAKERARVHGDSVEKHGITEDDAKMV